MNQTNNFMFSCKKIWYILIKFIWKWQYITWFSHFTLSQLLSHYAILPGLKVNFHLLSLWWTYAVNLFKVLTSTFGILSFLWLEKYHRVILNRPRIRSVQRHPIRFDPTYSNLFLFFTIRFDVQWPFETCYLATIVRPCTIKVHTFLQIFVFPMNVWIFVFFLLQIGDF